LENLIKYVSFFYDYSSYLMHARGIIVKHTCTRKLEQTFSLLHNVPERGHTPRNIVQPASQNPYTLRPNSAIFHTILFYGLTKAFDTLFKACPLNQYPDSDHPIGSITSRCSGKEPALREECRPDSRKRRKSSLTTLVPGAFSLKRKSHMWEKIWFQACLQINSSVQTNVSGNVYMVLLVY